MYRAERYRWLFWLGLGLVGGVLLCGQWPQTPLHAVATDRAETFAVATGYVDDGIEAVYFLDFLTGDLNAVVLGRRRQGPAFVASYGYNVLKDLGADAAKNPKYLLVTGAVDMGPGAGGTQLSRSAVYVAEVTTGRVAAYAIPWSRQAYSRGGFISMPLAPLAATQFRMAASVGTPPIP